MPNPNTTISRPDGGRASPQAERIARSDGGRRQTDPVGAKRAASDRVPSLPPSATGSLRFESAEARPITPTGTQSRGGGRLPLKVLAQLTKQLAVLLRAGSGIVPALSAIQRQMRKPAHSEVIGELITDLEDGVTLTAALRRHPHVFDAVYCAIVAAGEASGTLTQMLERLAGIVGKRRAMRKKIIGALAYPTLLVAMCGNILLVLLFFVLPRFKGMFEQLGVETPAITQAMLTVADVLRGYWPAFAGGLLGVVGLIIWLAMHDTGRRWASDLQLSIPLFGPLRAKLISAQVFRTMGMLLESGVGVLEALDLVRQSTRNRRFQKLFSQLETSVTSGGRLSTAFEESKIVEPSFCQAIHTGEDTGNLGGTMTFCADVLDETNEELVTVAMRLVEPIILIGMGLVVGGVAIALFLPLFDLTSAIK